MMSKPVVSVVIPFHNRFEWTLEAIQSVTTQSFQNYEIVLVDDGSDENTTFKWSEIDSRIRYLRIEKSKGPSKARNMGVSQARGKFISFLDSDDLFLPDKLEIQVNVMRAFPSVMLSYTAAIMINEKGNEFALYQVDHKQNVYPYIWENCSVLTPCVMVRREIMGNLHFEEGIISGEDLILWAQISSRFPLLFIEKPLTKVRFGNSNTSVDPEKFISHVSHVINDGVKKDQKLGFFVRHRILSNLNILIASKYLHLRNFTSILKHIFIAYLHFPFNPRFLRLLIKYSFLGKFIKLNHPVGITIPDEISKSIS